MSDTAEGIYPKHFEDIQYSSEANVFNTHGTGSGSDHSDVASNTSASHAEAHTIVSHSDTTATGAELNTLTGGGETTLHSHAGGGGGTSYFSFAGISFQPRTELSDFDRNSDGSWTTTQTGNIIYAALYLPEGAVITKAVVYANISNETWEIKRTTIASGAGDSVLGGGSFNTEDSTISNATVDNQTYAYYIKTSSTDSGDTIYGGRITYTL